MTLVSAMFGYLALFVSFPGHNVPIHQVAFGHYPEEHFCEEVPHMLIRDFQGELDVLSTVIKTRNKKLDIAYTYMDPPLVENSVAI